MMVVDNQYEVADIVYLITDTDQRPRMVTGFEITGAEHQLKYVLALGCIDSPHLGIEISTEKNYKTAD